MRFLHTSDLHLGRIVDGYSMLECQRDILEKMICMAREERAEAVVIAGDVYDRPVPAAEAVTLFDSFLTKLSGEGVRVMVISGNHDSPERLGFAGALLKKEGVYMAGALGETPWQAEFEDDYGRVVFTLLPFVKPALLGCASQQEAAELLLEDVKLSPKNRNVLVTHQFVTDRGRSPSLSDSENPVMAGGIEQVEAQTYRAFDYVALGHIHGPQKIADKGQVWYSGSPLKYSVSEARHKKGVNLVELKEKGEVCVRRIPLKPLRDLRSIKGNLKDLMDSRTVSLADREDYIEAILTDGEELLHPMESLKSVYPNILHIIFEKNRKGQGRAEGGSAVRSKSVMELFTEFYGLLRDEPLDGERRECAEEAVKAAGEGGENET